MHREIAAEIVDRGLVHELGDDDVAHACPRPAAPLRRGTLVEAPGGVENAVSRIAASRMAGVENSATCDPAASSAMLRQNREDEG
jgi:hypothetical protein